MNHQASLPELASRHRLLAERFAILLGSAIYLFVFNRTVPHGDAVRIVDQISQDRLVWNPNHLLFDPLGYGFYRLLQKLNIEATILGSFEFISAVSTIVALSIFHQILVRIGVTRASIRILSVSGLFASASFLSVALNQYYFMIQMPFLLSALYFYFDFFLKSRAGIIANGNLYAMGALLAIATTIMFNNLLVLAAIGAATALPGRSWNQLQIGHAIRIWGAAALIGFPVFILGYLLANPGTGFLTWLLSYQGDSSSKLNELYGLKWRLSEIIQATARMGFKFFLGNTVETAGLGSTLNALLLGSRLEFIPQYGKMLLSLIAAPAVVFLHAYVAYFTLRNLIAEPVVRLLGGWIAAYVVFNFLWNVGDEIFWLQIIPAVLLLLLLSRSKVSMPLLIDARPATAQEANPWWRYGPIVLVALVSIVNTLNAVLPISTDRELSRQIAHRAMLRAGDLEILPGWDQQKWIAVGDEQRVRKLMLMNMALAKTGSNEDIAKLPQIVAAHLETGGRVVVARLFDLDEDMMPWYSLAEMKWPRQRIVSALDPFCNRRLGEIDGFVFRELYACK